MLITVDTKAEPERLPPQGFQLEVLGGLHLSHDGTDQPIGSWQPRARTLFTIVATSPQMRRSRDDLIDLLWPDATPEAGASNLRYTVHLLRRALGDIEPSPLVTQGGWIELNTLHRWEIDLHRFEALANELHNPDALIEAAALYRGEALPEYRYEDWATPIRERTQRLWRDLAIQLAHVDLDQGRLANAARWYEQLLESDPLDEEALQNLLPLLAKTGRDTDALRMYGQFATQLRQELDVEPAHETVALVEQLRMQRALESTPMPVQVMASTSDPVALKPAYPLPTPGRLAGRHHELQRINAMLFQNKPDSTLRLLFVAAEAGMGKTRLLAEAAEMAYSEDMVVLAGGCYEEEGRLPWGPIHDALLDYIRAQPESLLRRQFDDLLPTLAQIVPEIRARLPDIPEMVGGDVDSQRLRLYSTIASVLERIARDRPLLLILDDLHWADEVTLQVLHFLVRQPGLDRVRLLGAYRSDEVAYGAPLESLQAKAGSGGAIELVTVQPLSDDELSVLLEDRLAGQCAEDLVRGLHQRSAGNPFFTLQMARLLEQEGGLQRDKGGWRLIPGTHIELPPAVRETVGRRLRHLDPAVRSVLAHGAVLGREFDYAPLETMATGTEESLFDALDLAREAGLLRESGEGYAFAHPLLWEVVYGRIPDQRRRRLHDQAGRSLEDLYGASAAERSAELAWHFVESGNHARALLYTLQAAERAAGSIAHADAERYFREAVNLARSLGDQASLANALEGLGGVLKAEAEFPEAIQSLDEAAQIWEALGDLDGEARVVAQLGLTWFFAPNGITSEHAQRLRSTLRRVEARDMQEFSLAQGRLAAALPRLLVYAPAEEFEAACRAAKLGNSLQNPSIEAAGYLRQGTALLGLSRYEESLTASSRAIVLAEQAVDLFTLAAACNFASTAAFRLGQGELSFEYSERAFNAAESRGGLEQLVGIAGGLFRHAFVLGEWDRICEFADHQFALNRSLVGKDTSAEPYLELAELSVHRGEWESWERNRVRADTLIGTQGLDRFRLAVLEVQVAVFKGRIEEALELITAAPKRFPAEWVSDVEIPRALALAAAGDAAAEGAAQLAVSDATERHHAVCLMEASHALAVALRSGGKYSDAIDVILETLPFTRHFPYPYLQGCLLYEWGCILSHVGTAQEARGRFEAALPLFQRLGARPYAERTQLALSGLSG